MIKLIKFLFIYFLGIFTVIIFQRYNPPSQHDRTLGESIQNVKDGLAQDYRQTKNGLAGDIDEAGEKVSQGLEATRSKTRNWLAESADNYEEDS